MFENFVYAELKKLYLHHGQRPPLFYWRDSNGREVDFLLDEGSALIPGEAKAGQTVAADFFKGLEMYVGLSGGKAGFL